MAEGCMSAYVSLTSQQQEELLRRVYASMKAAPEQWEWDTGGTTQYAVHRKLHFQVFATEYNRVQVYDLAAGLGRLVSRKGRKFLLWSSKTDPANKIWDLIHARRHAQVESVGQGVLNRFDEPKKLPQSILTAATGKTLLEPVD